MQLTPTVKRYPLTDLQEQMWYGHLLFSDAKAYTLSVCLHLKATDPDRLRGAFESVLRSDPIFSLRVGGAPDRPFLSVNATGQVPFDYRDLRGLPPDVLRTLTEERRNFILDPAVQTVDSLLVRTGETSFRSFVALHHLLADGWSVKVILERVARRYSGKASEVLSPSRSFFDYIAEHHRYRSSPEFDADERYWQEKLAQPVPATDFYGLPKRNGPGIVRVSQGLGRDRSRLIRATAQRLSKAAGNIALSNLFAAALLAYLHRLTGQSRLSLGVPFSHRRTDADRAAIGLYMQIGVYRLSVDEGETVRSLVTKVAEESAAANRHIHYTLNNRNNALYDVMFNFHNVCYESVDGLEVREEWLQSGNDMLPFTLHVRTSDREAIRLEFDLQRMQFPEAARKAVVEHYLSVLDQVVENPDLPLTQIRLPLPPQLAWKGHLQDLPLSSQGETLHDLFDRQAEATPDSVAVFSGKHRAPFRRLKKLSDDICDALRVLGCGPGSIVGVHMERSIGAVAALIGILKAGGIWLPLDPAYPQALLHFMRGDSGARIVVTQEPVGGGESALVVDPVTGAIKGWPVAKNGRSERGEEPGRDGAGPATAGDTRGGAFCLYTSGSTGKPKGVVGSHNAALNRLRWMWREYPLADEEVLLQKTSLSFIDSVWEIFGALLAGRSIVIAADAAVRDPGRLGELVAQFPIRRIILVPSLVRSLIESTAMTSGSFAGVSRWFVTGELFSTQLARRLAAQLPHAAIFNLYGTTETYDVACHRVEDADFERRYVPIGKAVDNMDLLVLDGALKPVPPGEQGELYVGGIGVAGGYLNRPVLTSQKFIWYEVSGTTGGTRVLLFRTGDAARVLSGGSVECLGRLDNQVKIRGYRVELEGIEQVLESLPGVSQALATTRGPDADQLFASVMPSPGAKLTVAQLRSQVNELLPPWMVPTIRVVEALPLTPSGKRRRLSGPPKDPGLAPTDASPRGAEGSAGGNGRHTVGGEAAGNEPPSESDGLMVQRLAAIWKRVLAVDRIGVADNFFDLGGNSLLAVRTMGEIERQFGVHLPLSALFESPTIGRFVDRHLHTEPSRPSPVAVQVGNAHKTPLFSVPPAGSTISAFSALARYLPHDQPVYSFEPMGIERGESPHRSIEEMARVYVREMQSVQPVGPYVVSGRCFGGYVAYEMAQQLLEAGEQVAALIIIDSPEAPLVQAEQRTHVGVRKLVLYYPERIRYFLSRGRLLYTMKMRLRNDLINLWYRLIEVIPSLPHSRERRLRLLRRVHTLAYHRYTARPYRGKITIVHADRLPDLTGERMKWERLALEGLEWRPIPSDHHDLMKEPNIQRVAAEISRCLEGINAIAKDAP